MSINTVTVLDVETTGLDPNEGAALLELAAVNVKETTPGDMASWSVADHWSSLVEYNGEIPPEARAVHHISPSMVAPGAPDCSPRTEVIRRLVEAERPGEMAYAIHNKKFDLKFMTELGLPTICTWKCAKHVWPEASSHKNQALRYMLNVEPQWELVQGLESHRALYDAAVTAEILRQLLIEYSPEQLVEMSDAPILLKTCNFRKHKGQPWSEVPKDYLRWMMREGVGKDDADLQYTIDYYLRVA